MWSLALSMMVYMEAGSSGYADSARQGKGQVVDQARGTEPGGGQQHGLAGGGRHRPEVGGAQLQVVGHEAGLLQAPGAGGQRRLDVAIGLEGIAQLAQGPVEPRCGGALLKAQVAVAGGEREAILG